MAVIKHEDQKKLRKKMIYFFLELVVYHLTKSEQELKAGTGRQHLKPNLWGSAAYWLTHVSNRMLS